VIRRETQTPTYWYNYQVSESDLERITTLFLETEHPHSIDQLVLEVMRYRCRQEEELIKRELTRGDLFQPRNSYEVGQTIVFPAQGYAVGEIVAIRPGHNPEYGEFRVARVKIQNVEREYAIELQAPHRLNYESDMAADDGLLSSEELYDLYQDPVYEMLKSYLEQDNQFAQLIGQWFLKALLIDVNVGHLNLAEAVLDMTDGGPLPTANFLRDLDLPDEVDEQLKVFSLNYALYQDERFDEVGPAGQVLWFLRAREPAEVLYPPRRLKAKTAFRSRIMLDHSFVELERELEDEWSDSGLVPMGKAGQVTLTLTFPHRRVGTLPLTPRLKDLFPAGQTRSIRFLFQDGTTGKTWPGWVLREERYVFGLDQWYENNGLQAGAYIELKSTSEPGVVEIDFQRRRPVREWVRVAVLRDGRLTFEMRKQLIGCQYDELMIVSVDDPAAVDQAWIEAEEKGYPTKQIIYDVFLQLARLSPQGTVHTKTLYSAVNVIRRLPPGPIFEALMEDMSFLPVGNNYWLYTKK
jgi:hypothetical protein